MRNTLNPCRRMLLSVVLLFLTGAAMASGFSDRFSNNPQVQNALDTLEATIESAVTNGKSTRGASGPMMQLIYSSDTLICDAWIIAFSLEVNRLTRIATHRDMTAEEHDVQRAARELLSRVERACQGVRDPAAATTPGTGGAAPPSAEPPPAGQAFTPRPGWTITDEICARKCAAESAADQRADWNQYRAEENEREARARLSAAERDLAGERENLSREEARLASARETLNRREEFNRRTGGVNRNSQGDKDARNSVRDAQEQVTRLRRVVEVREQEASQAREAAARATAARERAEQEAADAQAALDRCLRDCYRQAASASGTSSAGTSSGTSSGTAPGTSSGTSTSTGTTTNTSTGTTDGGFYNPSGE